MSFMKSEEGMNERRKVADLTKTLGTMSMDRNAVMFKIAFQDEDVWSHSWMAKILFQNLFGMRLWKAMKFLS